MVFGQLADSVPIFGSQRRVYVFLGASLVASGLIILAGAAGGWITFASKNALYVTAQLLIVVGVVLQDVIADAMTTEVVDRVKPDGSPRPEARSATRAWPRAGAGPACALVGHLVGRGALGLARADLQLPDRVPAGARRAGNLADRRHAGPPRWQHTEAHRLAHSRRWHRVRRRGPRHRPQRIAARPRACLYRLAHRHRADARAHRRRSRRAASQAHLLFRACHFPLSGEPRGRGGLSLVHHRRARLRRGVLRHAGADRRGAQPRRRLAVLRCHHPPADRQGAALADHRRHRPVAADHRARVALG